MDPILEIADRHGIAVVEDNAHGLFGSYRGRPLGTFGVMAAQSFHETKNFSCGEGGAIVINDPRYVERAEIILAASCSAVMVRDLDQAMQIANEFAPEHLLIVTENAAARAKQVENAGAVFVGAYATVPLGDYTAGPNHTLPTAGAARFASPLGVRTFMKQMSVLTLGRSDLELLHEATVRLAQMEGLSAHAHAVEVRLE